MIQLSLTEEEKLVMKKILQEYLSDLRTKAASTDRQDLRDILKKDEETIKRTLKALG
ncbi:MAG TPA: hypothetical protein PLU94_03485 [Methanoregulaceae archaeon]|nr:MAG: hypothetical protein BWY93_00418 [Euryarchaeota archaeon ADurb.BinA087]HPH34536.1 hypothetical protein [Methanoregulaceae archaeon]HPM61771.1 hypothetical protein [Methanoregulaceae archaeon]